MGLGYLTNSKKAVLGGKTVSEKVAGKTGDLRGNWPDDRRLTAPWED